MPFSPARVNRRVGQDPPLWRLELGEATEHGEYQPAVGRRGNHRRLLRDLGVEGTDHPTHRRPGL